MQFTDIQIRNLKPRADRYIEQEDVVKGSGKLGVRVSPKTATRLGSTRTSSPARCGG